MKLQPPPETFALRLPQLTNGTDGVKLFTTFSDSRVSVANKGQPFSRHPQINLYPYIGLCTQSKSRQHMTTTLGQEERCQFSKKLGRFLGMR